MADKRNWPVIVMVQSEWYAFSRADSEPSSRATKNRTSKLEDPDYSPSNSLFSFIVKEEMVKSDALSFEADENLCQST